MIFETEEDAIFELNKKIIVQRMKKEFAKGGKIKWEDHRQKKYFFYYSTHSKELIKDFCYEVIYLGTIYCVDKEIFDKFYDENEEDIKKYIIGIKEKKK